MFLITKYNGLKTVMKIKMDTDIYYTTTHTIIVQFTIKVDLLFIDISKS